MFLNPIEIIDDMDFEDEETFFITVTAGEDAAMAGYSIALDRMSATVVINENDSE